MLRGPSTTLVACSLPIDQQAAALARGLPAQHIEIPSMEQNAITAVGIAGIKAGPSIIWAVHGKRTPSSRW